MMLHGFLIQFPFLVNKQNGNRKTKLPKLYSLFQIIWEFQTKHIDHIHPWLLQGATSCLFLISFNFQESLIWDRLWGLPSSIHVKLLVSWYPTCLFRQPQSPVIPPGHGSIMSKRHCFAAGFPNFWLLKIYCPLFHGVPQGLGGGRLM